MSVRNFQRKVYRENQQCYRCLTDKWYFSGSCPIVEQNSFLKRVCIDDILGTFSASIMRIALYQCTHSDTKYIGFTDGTENSEYSNVCEKDPHSYQICGAHSKPKPSRSGELCQNHICITPDNNSQMQGLHMKEIRSDILCGRSPCGLHTCLPEGGCTNLNVTKDFCAVDNITEPTIRLKSGVPATLSAICNGVCDLHYRCDDEAMCGGYLYGMYCNHFEKNKTIYVGPREICNSFYYHNCRNGEDEANCPDLDSLPDIEKCEGTMYHMVQMIPILNNTRCIAPWWSDFAYTLDQKGMKPLCKNYMDQTNCTDPHRWKTLNYSRLYTYL